MSEVIRMLATVAGMLLFVGVVVWMIVAFLKLFRQAKRTNCWGVPDACMQKGCGCCDPEAKDKIPPAEFRSTPTTTCTCPDANPEWGAGSGFHCSVRIPDPHCPRHGKDLP